MVRIWKALASDRATGDEFGHSVVLDGTWAAIGAPKHAGAGAVYLFERTGAGWSERAKLMASDGVAGDDFGARVALADDLLVVSAADRNGGQGALYVFKKSEGSWLEQATLLPDNGTTTSAKLGDGGVVIAGGQIAATAYSLDEPVANAGGVYVFAVGPGGAWVQTAKCTDPDAAVGARIGQSLSFDGTSIVAGSESTGTTTNSGAVHSFILNGGTCVSLASHRDGDAVDGDRYADQLVIAENELIVSAYDAVSASGTLFASDLPALAIDVAPRLGTVTFNFDGGRTLLRDLRLTNDQAVNLFGGTLRGTSGIQFRSGSTFYMVNGTYRAGNLGAETFNMAGGTFYAPAVTEVDESATIGSGATFHHNNGQFVVDPSIVGDTVASVRFENVTFFDLTYDQDGTVFNHEPTTNFIVTNVFDAGGTVDSGQTLTASDDATLWTVNVGPSPNIDNVSVSYSVNTSGTNVNPLASTDNGNNTGWFTVPFSGTCTWVGATSNQWGNSANWDYPDDCPPGIGETAKFTTSSSADVSIPDGTLVGTIIVDPAFGVPIRNVGTVEVSDAFTMNGGTWDQSSGGVLTLTDVRIAVGATLAGGNGTIAIQNSADILGTLDASTNATLVRLDPFSTGQNFDLGDTDCYGLILGGNLSTSLSSNVTVGQLQRLYFDDGTSHESEWNLTQPVLVTDWMFINGDNARMTGASLTFSGATWTYVEGEVIFDNPLIYTGAGPSNIANPDGRFAMLTLNTPTGSLTTQSTLSLQSLVLQNGTFNGTHDVTTASFQQVGGTYAGTGTLAVTSDATWTAGTFHAPTSMELSGAVDVGAGVTFNSSMGNVLLDAVSSFNSDQALDFYDITIRLAGVDLVFNTTASAQSLVANRNLYLQNVAGGNAEIRSASGTQVFTADAISLTGAPPNLITLADSLVFEASSSILLATNNALIASKFSTRGGSDDDFLEDIRRDDYAEHARPKWKRHDATGGQYNGE